MRPLIVFGFALWPATALAEDEEGDAKSDSDISTLLDNLPDIEQKKPVVEEEEAPDDDPFATGKSDVLTDYVDLVRSQILANWKPKKGVIKKQPTLVAKLLVRVDGTGRFTGVSLLETSGTDKFDDNALKAVKDTEAVEAPPPDIVGDLSKGVVVEFVARTQLNVK